MRLKLLAARLRHAVPPAFLLGAAAHAAVAFQTFLQGMPFTADRLVITAGVPRLKLVVEQIDRGGGT